MSKALVKHSKAKGLVPAVASGFVPGLGQLINGETEKAIGVFGVSLIAGLGLWTAIPIVGGVAGIIAGGTWVYGVVDGYIGARKKRR